DTQPAIGGVDTRQDVHAYRAAFGRRHARCARHAGGCVDRQELEVLGRDRAIAATDLKRGARARGAEGLPGDTTERRSGIAHGRDPRYRRLEHRERFRRDVATATAPVAVAGDPQRRPLRRNSPELAPAAVGLTDRRPELDLAEREIDPEVFVDWSA